MDVKWQIWSSYICMKNKPLLPFERKSYFSHMMNCGSFKHYCTLRDNELPLVFCIKQQMAGVTLVSNLDWVKKVLEERPMCKVMSDLNYESTSLVYRIFFLPISDAVIDSFLQSVKAGRCGRVLLSDKVGCYRNLLASVLFLSKVSPSCLTMHTVM